MARFVSRHPPLFIRLSILLHVAAAVTFVLWPGFWAWLLALLVINHLLLVWAGLWPRSQVIGENMVRLPKRNRDNV